ncbi:uncharacterized protein LOC105662693 [Megachile rotundata]|uniref:uncharacterized protein LOC105662693 n=1 Tax=Megachile rotundata TaxID=143995 RepID=UPI003FD0770A
MDTGTMEERYLKLTKNFLIISGIWPDQYKPVQFFCRLTTYIATGLSVITQVTRMVRYFSFEVVVEQLPFFLAAILVFVKHTTYVINSARLKKLLTGMCDDWKIDRSKEEVAIMTSYMDRGALIAKIYTANACSTTALFIQIPFWPRIADIVMPLNTSRPRAYIIPASFPVDEDKYYYWIILQMAVGILNVMFVYVACDTCFVYAVQHACGLFATCGYRFKEAIRDVPAGSTISDLSTETYRRVCRSAEAHNRAITFLQEIEDIHFGYLLICLGIITAAFSGTLALLSTMKIGGRFYQCIGFLVAQLIHLFFLTIQGQFVINSKWKAYNEIYDGLWYHAEPKTQVPYMLALRATLSAPEITAGRRIPMNLETFASIIKASVSYFTMLKAT